MAGTLWRVEIKLEVHNYRVMVGREDSATLGDVIAARPDEV